MTRIINIKTCMTGIITTRNTKKLQDQKKLHDQDYHQDTA